MADKIELTALIRQKKVEAAKLLDEQEQLEPKIESISRKLQQLPIMESKEKQEVIAKGELEVQASIEEAKSRIESSCANTMRKVQDILKEMPGSGREFAGKYEINSLEDSLSKVYPRDLVIGYTPLRVELFDNEGQAYAQYSEIQRRIMRIKNGDAIGFIFNSFNSLFNTVADKSNPTKQKAAMAVIAVVTIAFLFVPVLFLASLGLIGLSSLTYGLYIRKILTDMYDIRNFLNESYNEDIFNRGCEMVTREASSFIEEAKASYLGSVNSRKFTPDDRVLEEISLRYKSDKDRLESTKQSLERQKTEIDDKITELWSEIDSLGEKAQNWAETLKINAFEKINWNRSWLENIVIDISESGQVRQMKNCKGNSLFVAKDMESLQTLLQLVVHQTFLQMHPMFAKQSLVDYKEMGGRLVVYKRLPPSGFAMFTSQDEIKPYIERCTTEIRQRIDKIFSASDSLDSFNEILTSCGGEGEAYNIIHIIGSRGLVEPYPSLLTNGPKAGFFFKFYMTFEELRECSKDFRSDYFSDIYLVSDTVAPMGQAQLKRLMESSS